MGGFIARFIRVPLSVTEMASLATKTIMLGISSAYIFDIANQSSSPEEDRINKPHRPIPAGLISVNAARTRWGLSWLAGPVVAYYLLGIWPMWHIIHWQILIFILYAYPAWQNWFMRSYFAAAGYVILGRLLNEMFTKYTNGWDVSLYTETFIFFWFLATVHIQEFHDIEGDQKSGRKTLPLLLSHRQLKVLRAYTSIFFVIYSLILSIYTYQMKINESLVILLGLLQQILSCMVAYRVSFSTSQKMDKHTYIFYYYTLALTIQMLLILLEV